MRRALEDLKLHRLEVIHNHAFKPIALRVTPSVVMPVVKPDKVSNLSKISKSTYPQFARIRAPDGPRQHFQTERFAAVVQ